jgi:hypothetical protein
MEFLSIQLFPYWRSVVSLFFSTMLFCSTASPQEVANAAGSKNSKISSWYQGVETGNSQKDKAQFVPPAWPPVDVDDAEVVVNSQVPCPLPGVLQGASQHAIDFSEDLERFTATEVIQSGEARKNGRWNHLQTQTFKYTAVVTRPRPGVAYVDESREAKSESALPPVQARGLAITALIFHPQRNNDFLFACEGMGEWHGKPSWLIHFVEREQVSVDFQVIHIDNNRYGVKLKGRAWIGADDYEIEHIDVDLLQQIPKIRLVTEHTSIEYGSVGFKNGTASLWLPQKADFYLEIGGHHYFIHDELRDFLLFSVNIEQEDQEPRLSSQ